MGEQQRAVPLKPQSRGDEANLSFGVEIGEGVELGSDVHIRDLSCVRENCSIGANSRLGRGVYLGPGVLVGKNCKIQNLAQIFEPASIGDGCFVGPAAVLTNDRNPRAVSELGLQLAEDDWSKEPVVLETGVSVGAGAVCIGPITIGAWSLIAAGAVVSQSFPKYSLVAGVPARRIGWVGESGVRLVKDSSSWLCPKTGNRFFETDSGLQRG